MNHASRVIIDNGTIEAWRDAGVSEEFIKKTRPLQHKEFQSKKAFTDTLIDVFGGIKGVAEWHQTLGQERPGGDWFSGPIAAYQAEAFLGQYLTIIPQDHLVAVRQLRSPENKKNRPTCRRHDGFYFTGACPGREGERTGEDRSFWKIVSIGARAGHLTERTVEHHQ